MADPATPERSPVARGARARERVLRAALEVLADRGASGFTMEAIADAAQASKATLYRHWRSRSALLVDAMELAFPSFEPASSGDLRRDLTRLLTGQESRLRGRSYPRLMAAIIDAAEREPALAAWHQDLTERRRRPLASALRAARDRGEIRADVDVEVVVDLLGGTAFYRRLIAHRDFPAGYTAAVVEYVLRAVRVPARATG